MVMRLEKLFATYFNYITIFQTWWKSNIYYWGLLHDACCKILREYYFIIIILLYLNVTVLLEYNFYLQRHTEDFTVWYSNCYINKLIWTLFHSNFNDFQNYLMEYLITFLFSILQYNVLHWIFCMYIRKHITIHEFVI